MTTALRVVVGLFGLFFSFLGAIAALGPGFPIVEASPRSLPVLLTQAFASGLYGATLLAAAFLRRPRDDWRRVMVAVLIAAPLALWLMSRASTTDALVFLPFYLVVSGAGLAALAHGEKRR